MERGKGNLKENPRATANVISILFFWWLKDIFKYGKSNNLKADDLYALLPTNESKPLTDKLARLWNEELKAAERHQRKPKLLTAIRKCFLGHYMILGGWLFVSYVILKTAQPICLSFLISYFNPASTMTLAEAWCYAIGVVVLSTIVLVINHHSSLALSQVGMRCRIACCSLVYRKVLRLSRSALGRTAAGQMVNLLSNDVARFDIAVWFLHFVWIMPIQAVFISYMIYRSAGVAMFAGVVAITMQSVPLQSFLSRQTARLRGKMAKQTDERIRLMNELLVGVQVVKMYAWEEPFQKMVARARKLELNVLTKMSYIRGFSMGLMVYTERTTLYLTLLACVLLGQEIRGEMVYAISQYYQILQLSMAIFYPMAMTLGGEAIISIKRLQEILLLEENNDIKLYQRTLPKKNGKERNSDHIIVNDAEKINLKYIDDASDNDTETVKLLNGDNTQENKIFKGQNVGQIVIKNAKARWQDTSISDTLSIDLKIEKGNFCAVVGAVGSGKSSLLQLILRELPLRDGTIQVNGNISFSSQEAWLFPATVRNNILFGLPFDKTRYQKVVFACALTRDFELFPYGDNTMVGDRGASLSGGQRARINLARAAYREADVYLLDDPFSAVDHNVGEHIMAHLLGGNVAKSMPRGSVKGGFLGDKTRVLCTHQLHLLTAADTIVVMGNGRVEAVGTFEDVSGTDMFSELMVQLAEHEKEAGKKPPEEEAASPMSRSRTLSRSPSVGTTVSDDLPCEHGGGGEEEQMSQGMIGWGLYGQYFKAGGGIAILLLLTALMVLGQAAASGADYWVKHWTNQEEVQRALRLNNLTNTRDNSTDDLNEEAYNNSMSGNVSSLILDSHIIPELANGSSLSHDDSWLREAYNDNYLSQETAVYVYTFCIVSCIIFMTLRSLLFFKICINASKNLHNNMFGKILGATMRFFDLNPSGRILNRFSKDMGAVDEILPRAMLDTIQVYLVMLGIFLMIGLVNPYIMFLIVPVGALFVYIRNLYLYTAQDIKRLEGTTRSPVFGHMTSTLSGLPTIRASNAQSRLENDFDSLQDVHTAAWYLHLATSNAFGFWLDAMSVVFMACVTMSFLVIEYDNTYSGSVGLAITQALILTGMLQHGVRQNTEVVSQMTSLERLIEYTNIDQEKSPDTPPPKGWPTQGKVEFKKTTLKYDPEGAPVLKELDLTIEPGWKVGIVGRTGAGKSSIIAALFRLAPTEGSICIDGLDTGLVSLKSLRGKISIIPQDPVLFCETMRYNLDPFKLYSDAEIWRALEDVELKNAIPSLSHSISEGGGNLSAGQRQLVCLARAILRNNNILVLDEATANVDTKTDTLIQKTIRTNFAQCTVITIAHRLNTVIDSDRILVLDAGRCLEWGNPQELLKIENGTLRKMWEDRQASGGTS